MTQEEIEKLICEAADSLRIHLLPWSYSFENAFFPFNGGQFSITGEYDIVHNNVYLTDICASFDDETEYVFTEQEVKYVQQNYNVT